MVSLVSLPNELIYQVSQRIQPDDIENYAYTNRRIRNIAKPFLQEHRACKSKFTKIAVNGVTAASFFYEVCARPWSRSYPRVLELNWRGFAHLQKTSKVQTDDVVLKRSVIREEDIRYLLRLTELIPEHAEDEWIDKVELEDEDTLFALMLACLPNLQRLVIRLDNARLEQVKEMLRTIKRQQNNLHPPKALHRLVEARVLEREGSNNTSNLEIFPLVAAIPGIKVLHGRNLVGMYRDCYRDGWLTYPGASPSIEKIYLETCGMSTEGLEMLCKSLKSLRSFSYVAHR